MSINAIEKALWKSTANPADAQRLREDARSYLEDYRLDDLERSLMASWDIRALVERGVHPMVLMMAFAAVNGPAASATYVEKVNTPNPVGASK